MNKKGQHMLGLPFVFIIGLIIMAIIIVSAVFAIQNFTCRQEQITINLFVSDLRNAVEEAFYNARGTQTIFEGTLPKGCSNIELVCLAFPSPRRDMDFGELKNDLDIDSVKAGEIIDEISLYGNNYNLFLYPRDGLGATSVAQAHNINRTIKIPVEFEKNPLCIENIQGRKIELLLENKGTSVRIKK